MEVTACEREWAKQEFGTAKLGDPRRVKRLVEMAATAANQPAGQVTAVFREPKAREGAFRLLENEAVAPEEIARASHRACARRASVDEVAFVAIDGTSLNLTDRKQTKGLGVVGARAIGATGLQVMTALCVSREGVPLGLCGQEYWARAEPSSRKRKTPHNIDSRPTEKRETQHWLNVIRQVRATFKSEAPLTKPWFQMDRGGDAWPVLLEGLNVGDLFTIRAAQDRRLAMEGSDEPRRYLWKTLEEKPLLGTMMMPVKARPASKGRQSSPRPARAAREAQIELRAAEVQFNFRMEHSRIAASPKLFALLACETKKSAGADAPIEWLLLTNRPITNLADAKLVLHGYAQRWRIEEFHKCWKSGVCKVEHMQLREGENIQRWATVLAAVAVRVLRLTYLSRHAPWLPSTDELTSHEIDAIIIASKNKTYRPGTVPPIEDVTGMVAVVGGYIGRSSGGPPGPLVISRGLLKIEALADALEENLVKPA